MADNLAKIDGVVALVAADDECVESATSGSSAMIVE
jgi:hypothetical protein